MARKTSKSSKLRDLLDGSYIGQIVDVDDPEFVGRCKISVFGVFDGQNLGKIPTSDLPWAYPYNDVVFGSKSGSGKFSTPKMGAMVRVRFHQNQYHPRYFSLEELDDELKALIKDDYSNFHSILFDSEEQLKIYYSKKSGMVMNLKDSIINIGNDNAILLKHKNGSAIVELRGNDIDIVANNSVNSSSQNNITINSELVHINGVQTDIGSNAIFSAVNGEILMKLLKMMALINDSKFPSSPGATTNLVDQMEPLILSKTVKTTG